METVTMPVIFKKEASLYFEVPPALRGKKWKCVAVFGDSDEATAAIYPANESMFSLDYPEKKIVETVRGNASVRKVAVDPLIEHVVKTRSAKVPQITLFLRMPKGVSDASELEGVLTMGILAPYVEQIRRDLQKEEMGGDYNGLLSFANKHKLAVLAWGIRPVWRDYKDPDDSRLEADIAAVVEAWSQGVDELSKKYGIPRNGYLLWGSCASSQWAQQICQRKPEHFLAAFIHIPGARKMPTAEAAKVWWCLTIGELDAGYERSTRWFTEAMKQNYPVIYRTIPGMGHETMSPTIAELTIGFLEFALAQRDNPKRGEFFTKPEYYADYTNQVVFPAAEADKIPAPFRVALPNKKFADLWKNAKK